MVDYQKNAAYTYFDQDMVAPQQLAVAGGAACVFSARCPTKETANEDAAAVVPVSASAAVLLVADGLGGGVAGEQAARLAIEALQQSIDESRGTDDLLRSAIITGFERANASVLAMGVGAATTLAAVEINAGVARPFYVGDSMILIVGGRGKIKLQTVPHSPVGYGVEAGLINEDEAMHHEHRHIVSNFIGTEEMHIAIGPRVKLARRDTVLVGSDGLFDNLYCDTIAEMVRKGNLLAATQQLATESQHRMQSGAGDQPSKPDDLTLVAYRMD